MCHLTKGCQTPSSVRTPVPGKDRMGSGGGLFLFSRKETRKTSKRFWCAGQSGSAGHRSYEWGKLTTSLAGVWSVWVGGVGRGLAVWLVVGLEGREGIGCSMAFGRILSRARTSSTCACVRGSKSGMEKGLACRIWRSVYGSGIDSVEVGKGLGGVRGP